ncbi:MAG: YfhO family protein, partial [Planctomycetes bacterium]|nr:YfhO family protein [Planctomycetota bacterium]
MAAVVSLSLTAIFWPRLWQGAGLVGGDIYAYYLPQKAFYAECLREGTLPLWNNRIGNGYPQLAESQTGVFYPLNLVLYRWLDLNTAINATVLFHYWLAFISCWLLARRLGCGLPASILAALVYTYGWFPARISLEWAIIGGAWLPLAVWCAESYMTHTGRKWLAALSLILTLQLLAGHFQIAFLTQLLLVGYVAGRLWWADQDLPEATRAARSRISANLGGALLAAFLLAAVQLFPTWELKTRSQRSDVNGEHDPSFGAVPPIYLSQVVAPWIWYPEKESFAALFPEAERARVNRVDAHLYFGLVPLALAIVGFGCTWKHRHTPAARASTESASPQISQVRGRLSQPVAPRLWIVWAGLGLAAVLYMPGWFLPVTRYLPGFNFFQGPGRFGIIATLAAALLAASGFQQLIRSMRHLARPIFGAAVLGLTLLDLLWVSDLVHDAEPVDDPPVQQIANSTLRRALVENTEAGPVRILSEGYNIPSIVGVGTLPVYLGLSPSPYYDPQLALPKPFPFREV